MNQKQFLEDLKTFISFKTISGQNPKEFDRCYSWIKSLFDRVDVELKDYEKNGVKSLLIKPRQSSRPHILGLGHIDVVPAPDKLFKIQEKEGWLYGRGVSDMKTQDLVMLYVLREILNGRSPADFWIVLTGDEELTGANGTKYVLKDLKKNKLMPQIAYIPDAGSYFSFLEIGKGAIFFKATTQGKATHAGQPWMGENAILKMMRFIEELNQLFPNPQKEKWANTLSATTISGGKTNNMIPDLCEAGFDLRLIQKQNPNQFFKQIKKIAHKHQVKVDLTEEISYPVYNPRGTNEVEKFCQIIQEVIGKPPKNMHDFATTDAKYFGNTPVKVLMTCHEATGWHQENERCKTNSIWQLYEIVKRTALEI